MRLVALVAAGRVAIGAAFGLAPRQLLALLLRTGAPADETVMVMRMLAARDLALGLGTLAAWRADRGALRSWVAASALADAADTLSFGAARPLRPLARLAGAATAGGSALLQARELRVLGR